MLIKFPWNRFKSSGNFEEGKSKLVINFLRAYESEDELTNDERLASCAILFVVGTIDRFLSEYFRIFVAAWLAIWLSE